MLVSIKEPLVKFLLQHPPFDAAPEERLQVFLVEAVAQYFPNGTRIPIVDARGSYFYVIQRGAVTVQLAADAEAKVSVQKVELAHFGEGEGFPVAAALDDVEVPNIYLADGDAFALRVPMSAMRALMAEVPSIRQFYERSISQLYQQSLRTMRNQMQVDNSSERTLHLPLSELIRRAPITCKPETTLREALTMMDAHNIGALPVVNDVDYPEGILIAQKLIGSVMLPELPLTTAVGRVMTTPVVTLRDDETALQAALQMTRQRVRYVLVLRENKLVGILSERDLFHLHRRSLHSVTDSINVAETLPQLQAAAAEIRALAQQWLAQGSQVETMTWMVSSLNDQLTRRIFELTRARHGLHGVPMCWLAFGSEGRHEQTIASDQDNGLVYKIPDSMSEEEIAGLKPMLLAFSREVNETLAACGFMLCPGNVMASNPDLCLTSKEWLHAFEKVMRAGSMQDLLNAVIWFDLRAVVGDEDCIAPLMSWLQNRPSRENLFLRMLTSSALNVDAPLGWMQRLRKLSKGGEETINIKTQGTRLFVDGARILALAHGITATNTANRLRQGGAAAGISEKEISTWVDAFHFMQSLRLRGQMEHEGDEKDAAPTTIVNLENLNGLDRRILKEALQAAEQLQDYLRRTYTPGE